MKQFMLWLLIEAERAYNALLCLLCKRCGEFMRARELREASIDLYMAAKIFRPPWIKRMIDWRVYGKKT